MHPTALALLLLLAQTPVTPPDPPSSLPAEAETEAGERLDGTEASSPPDEQAQIPEADDASAEDQPDSAATSQPAEESTAASQPAQVDDAPPYPPEVAEDVAPAEDPRILEAQPDSQPAPASMPSEPPAPALPPAACPVEQLATPLLYGGAGLGAVALLGAGGFMIASLYERSQAQDLLDSSPAFGKVGDSYVVRQPGDPDVAAYDGHRATASVMGQLGWIALGLSTTGAAVAGTAALLSAEAEGCQAR